MNEGVLASIDRTGEIETESRATGEAAPVGDSSSVASLAEPNSKEADSDGGRQPQKVHSPVDEAPDGGALKPWDFSNRKVVLQNIHRYDDAKRIRKLLHQWTSQLLAAESVDVQVDKIKKPPKDNWATVTLKEECMVQPLIDYVNRLQHKIKNGRTIVAKRLSEASSSGGGEALHNPRGDKRGRLNGDSNDGNRSQEESRAEKRQRLVEEARKPATEEEVKDAVVPLWRQPADEQLSFKVRELIKGCALRVVKETKARFQALSRDKNRKSQVRPYKWLTVACPIRIGKIVPVPSPVRNKSEFTFGYRFEGPRPNCDEGSDTEQRLVPSLGVCAKGWAGGVSRPHVCPNMPVEACAIVDVVEGFLRDSPLPPYDTFHHTGIWRTLTVRTSRRTRECMVIIVHSPASGGVGERDKLEATYADSFEVEKQRLVSLLTAAELPIPDQAAPLKVTSIFFQEFQGVSHPSPEHPVQHAFGATFLTERLGDCSFQISPGAFFQVNTEGAELLYGMVIDKVRDVVKDPAKTLLFDVCCGTGTIGISCLKAGVVGRVVGVDVSEPAIRDAERNAELNGFSCVVRESESIDDGTNDPPNSQVRFIASRAEEVLGREISKAKGSGFDFVAVVDPAREGLHSDVCKTLRSNGSIRRIVYVSCNPTGTLVRDAALLCAPPTKRYSGRPFRVTSATPVDMFPMTNHCELVMTFDRMDDDDLKDTSDGDATVATTNTH